MAIVARSVADSIRTSPRSARLQAFLGWAAERLPTRLIWLGAPAACGWVLSYILFRAVQSYPLDAFEEFELHKAVRWTHRASLYGAATEEVFPEAYPPLYFWLLGAWTRCLGESWATLRSLSLLAFAGVVAAGWWALRDASDRRVARLAFVTVLLALYALTGKWFEVGKPDTLLALFLAVGIVTGEHRSWREAVVSSVALWLASLTKQNAPLFVLPLCLAHVAGGRRRWAVAWGAAMGAAIIGSYAVLDQLTDGNFSRWVFAWTAGHAIDWTDGLQRVSQALLTRAPILLVGLAWAVTLQRRNCWTWSLVTALAVAVLGMSKQGGLENHLLPAAFVGSVVAARAAAALWNQVLQRPSGRVGRWAAVAALVLAVWPGLPTRRDFRWLRQRERETAEWVKAVHQLDGRVAVSHHLLLARQAGADCFFSDLILRFPGLVVPAPVRDEIAAQRFDFLILAADPDTAATPGWGELINANYTPAGELHYPNRSDLLPRRLYAARRLADRPSGL